MKNEITVGGIVDILKTKLTKTEFVELQRIFDSQDDKLFELLSKEAYEMDKSLFEEMIKGNNIDISFKTKHYGCDNKGRTLHLFLVDNKEIVAHSKKEALEIYNEKLLVV